MAGDSRYSEEGSLTGAQIVQLARGISCRNMKSIAEGYLDIEPETVESLSDVHRADDEAFKRALIRKWAYKPENSAPDQVKKLASLLYQASSEESYVDARKVHRILGISEVDSLHKEAKDTVTEDDVRKLGEDLKQAAERGTRIETAPWTKEYSVDMDKQYTNLHVEQIENQPTGPKGKKLDDYKELFYQGETEISQNSFWHFLKGIFVIFLRKFLGSWMNFQIRDPVNSGCGTDKTAPARRGSTNRILVKGEPGIGKTTFAKKILWDWANGMFTYPSVVFFVSMKLIKPNEAIENILIEQTPMLQGLHITETKFKTMLDDFGRKFLIILDGFDEHCSEDCTNEDIMRLLRRQKFPFCHVILTSRSHATPHIACNFQIILQIQGFTRENATEFASRALVNQTKVKDVLEVQCPNTGQYLQRNDPVYTCPILLLFICILTNTHEIDPSSRIVSLGEIYTKLVRCLYKKYTDRKCMEFGHDEFVDTLTNIGKLAFKCLQSKKPWFKKSEISQELGDDAFDYGLLVGSEDFKLMGDKMADIVIEFPHRTIQEYLAAFYVVRASDVDASFMDYPLVLHFCLWLLSDSCHKNYFPCDWREKTHKAMVSLVVDKIDTFKVNLPLTFTKNMNLGIDNLTNDKLLLEFLQNVLSHCTAIRFLRVCYKYGIDWLMNLIRLLLPQLLIIHLSHSFADFDEHHCSRLLSSEVLQISTESAGIETALQVLEQLGSLEKPLVLTISGASSRGEFAISKWPEDERIEHLYIRASGAVLTVKKAIPRSMSLKCLSLCELRLDETAVKHLGTALQNNKLPNLAHLDLTGSDIQGKLSNLFQGECSSLKHLALDRRYFDKSDINILSKGPSLLPQLTSLKLSCEGNPNDELGTFDYIFRTPWPTLNELTLQNLTENEYTQFIANFSRWEHKTMKKVMISMLKCDAPIKHFEPVNIETLTHLTLHRFICTKQHLHMVTQSKILTQLHKLDISHSSGITGTLSILLCHSFPSLNSLTVSDCGLSSKDLCSLAHAKAKGRLPELKHLDVSENNDLEGQLECLFVKGFNGTSLKA